MFRKALMAGIMLAALSAPALAWTARTGGSGPQAIGQDGGSASAQGQRQSQSSQSNSAASATGGSARSSAQGGGGGNSSVTNSVSGGAGYNGGVGLTVPGGYGNAPCGGGLGLGGLGLSGGGSGGGTLWEFSDCKRMRESAALRDLGYPGAALAELCQIDRVRDAFGGHCPSAHLVLDTDAGANDYCFTRNAGDKNQHLECDRIRREVR